MIHPPTALAFSTRRRWLYRFLAMGILPLLVLGFLELVLRLAGSGYPTSFFLHKQIKGNAMLVENSQFGRRFFPPALARSPIPVVMRARKPAGVYRIFLLGESAAMGDPRPAYGVGRYLETLLRERYPGREFEVVCAAMTAINSHALLPIARECARYQGDLWIVYLGHNEMAGPFGANTVFGLQAPPGFLVRAHLALQQFRVGQGLVALVSKLARRSSTPATWGGLKMFLAHQLPPADPRRERVYANFRRNLDDLIQAGRRAQVPIILCNPASNLKDCAPFGSRHSPAVSESVLADWDRLCQLATARAAPEHWAEAVQSYQQAAQLSPRYAEVHFRLGQCFLSLTNSAAAAPSFALARDLDSLPFRADSRINALIEASARKYAGQGVFYLDAVEALAPLSPSRIPGQEVFYEHVHLNFNGNYRLARALADQVAACLPADVAARQTAGWAEPEVCAQRLGLTDWNRLAVMEEVTRRLSEAPFTNQSNHALRFRKLLDQMAEIRQRLPSRAPPEARITYEEAIRKHPDDHWLHHNYAEYLKAVGDLDQATVEMQKVRDLTPHHCDAYLQVGRLLARQKKYDEARPSLETALRLRPDLGEAYLELGQVLANQGKLEAALEQYATAQRWRPDDAAVLVRRAEVLIAQNKRDEAIRNLREALRLRPAAWETRYRLGAELAADEKNPEAQAEFAEVIRLRPDHVLAHLNLGIMLARQDRYDEALRHFQDTLRLDPQNAKAREFIQTIEQLKTGKTLP